jgi:hypothetical protein
LIFLILLGEDYKPRSSSLRGFLHPPVISALFGSNILLSTYTTIGELLDEVFWCLPARFPATILRGLLMSPTHKTSWKFSSKKIGEPIVDHVTKEKVPDSIQQCTK